MGVEIKQVKMYQMRYQVVPLKKALENASFAQCMQNASDHDITYMDITSVRSIIDFKLDTYVFTFSQYFQCYLSFHSIGARRNTSLQFTTSQIVKIFRMTDLILTYAF